MENTIKNMELVLLEIRKNVMTKSSDTRVPKTLIHSYLTLLRDFDRMDKVQKQSLYGSLGVQADQLHIIKRYIKDDKMQELFNANDYVGINNYATVLDKIGQALDAIGEPERSLYTPSKLIEHLLNHSIQTGTLATFFDEAHRGMGKTTALIKKAHELDSVLVTGLSTQARVAQDIAENMGLNVNIASAKEAATLAQYQQKMKENGYLVDELVSNEQLRSLRGYKLLGGFTRIVI